MIRDTFYEFIIVWVFRSKIMDDIAKWHIEGANSRLDLTGFRSPTDREKKAVWEMLRGRLFHSARVARVVSWAAWIIAAVAFFVIETTGLEGNLSVQQLQFSLTCNIAVAAVAYAFSKKAARWDAIIGRMVSGWFQVADVFGDRFQVKTGKMSSHGYVYISDTNGFTCPQYFPVDAGIATKYNNDSQIPMLYIWEAKGDFYCVFAKEELFGCGDPDYKGEKEDEKSV